MKEENISKVVEKVINNYLDAHSNLGSLFNEQTNTVEVYSFYQRNFNTIFSTMGHLFHEDLEYRNHLNNLYSDFLNYIETELGNSIEK